MRERTAFIRTAICALAVAAAVSCLSRPAGHSGDASAYSFNDGVENAAPADGASSIQMEGDTPIAPAEYRRPKGWKHKGFKWDIPTISARESDRQIRRAAKEMERIGRVNAEGRYHATAESIDSHPCPEWFVDAKFGIFVDWGPWSVASYCPYVKGERLYPDWYEHRCRPGSRDYEYHALNWGEDFVSDDFIDLFQGKRFDARALARTFEAGGARYVVPFLKHHGGFCLWNSSWTYRDSYDRGAKRDFAAEMSKACRAQGLKFGFYDSLQGEWEYPVLGEDGSIRMYVENSQYADYNPHFENVASGKVAVHDVFSECMVPQAVEFIDRYDPDILWFDYDWTIPASKCGAYDVAAYFYNKNEGRKEVAVNDRYGLLEAEEDGERVRKVRSVGQNWCRTVRGDFFTDEWGDTDECIDPASWHAWESCSGISKSYGNHWMEQYDPSMVMTDKEFIIHFMDIVSRGGNLLLMVNLDGQGALPDVQRARIESIGKWLDRWGEGIYGTRIIAPFSTSSVDYTRSKDGKTVYATVKENDSGEVALECEIPDGSTITILGENHPLPYQRLDSDASRTMVAVPDEYADAVLPYILAITLPAAR
ncbi:MAG: alpha-L-fucosidase [Bacteroidales bacterium]|nr:alpha-L-fucosidase [Bacteroidales bacterium]